MVPRDDPKIWQLYNGLSCAEIPVFPNGSCNEDQKHCVIPTPGNLTSACPNKAGKHLPRRVAKRNMRKGQEKKRNKKGGRAGRLGRLSERKMGLCGKSSQAADPPPVWETPVIKKKSWVYFSF